MGLEDLLLRGALLGAKAIYDKVQESGVIGKTGKVISKTAKGIGDGIKTASETIERGKVAKTANKKVEENVANQDELQDELLGAILAGDCDLLGKLIIAGADVNARDDDGWTGLLFAVVSETPDTNLIKLLIDAGADVNARDDDGNTALLFAILKDIPDIHLIKMLIDAGADVNAKDNDGNTALKLAKGLGLDDVVKLLVKNGGK